MKPLFDAYGLDLVGRGAFAEHRIEIEGSADRLRGLLPCRR